MSLALSSAAADAGGLTVNKRELARVLGVSLPTIENYLDRYDDFPVVKRGTNGSSYVFDPIAVRDFLDAQQALEQESEARRQEAIAQLGLPLNDAALSDELTPKERLDYVRAIAAEDKLRLERGFLVQTAETRMAMTAAISRWNRALHAAVRQACRDLSLPDAVQRDLIARLSETQRALVRELKLEAEAHEPAA